MKNLALRFAIFAAALIPHGTRADTIDAKAQPYIVGGSLLAGIAFIALGIFLIQRGLGTRRIARESLTWPTVSGKILSAKVAEKTRQTAPNNRYTYYVPEARYAYEVAGKKYEGNIIRAGMAQFGYSFDAAAREQLAPYKAGSSVPVHYDPADPSVAMLEAAEYGGARNIFGGALLAIAGAGGLALALWSASLATH